MIGEINFFKKVCIPQASIHKSFTERAILTSKTSNFDFYSKLRQLQFF